MKLAIVEKAGLTDVGRQRASNEDSYFEAAPVFAVADGMGGARAGEVASRLAVEAFAEHLDESRPPEQQLAAIARAANRRIHEMAQSDESRAGMGTTLTAAIVGEHDVSIGHVGDSRAYRLRDGDFERLTTDHSLVEDLVRRGELTPEQAEHHPQKSIITRALGPEPEVDVETFTCRGREGDVYLLCSDGLTAMVSEEQAGQILRSRSSLEDAAHELVTLANANGGRDNITVLLLELGLDPAQDEEGETGELDSAQVHAALSAGAGEQAVEEHRAEGGRAAAPRVDEHRAGETAVIDAETAARARARGADDSRDADSETVAAPGEVGAALGGPARRPRRSLARRALSTLVVLLLLGALTGGLYLGGRSLYFVGTSDDGLVALYQGLPYDGPFGTQLYAQQYESGVPAASIPEFRRERILDHRLTSRANAVDLIHELELGRIDPGPS